MHAPTVSIYFVNAALASLREQPETFLRLIEQNHIPKELLKNDSARVPGVDFSNLLRDIMLETKDEQMGLGPSPLPLGSWATLAQLSIAANNLGEAIRRLARFYRLLPLGIDTRLDVSGDVASFKMIKTADHPFPDYVFESFLFYVSRFSNWLINKLIPLISVDFCFSETPHRSEYRNLFITSNVNFNCECSQFNFPRRYLNEPIRQDNYSLAKFLEHSNLSMVAQRTQHKNWRTKVQQQLILKLDQNPSVNDIAQNLGVHPHTLRSHLRREGVQFKDIKDQLRCEIAIDLLRKQGCSVAETAIKIGFSETSAFTRAFKKWMGVTPIMYKQFNN
ncbi:DNA-binding domain-containing protein, AraC-type [Spongiibacter sp. IMCC21906]|uniref:AraC family transcriptional regulator n=1 Tax=Spongiibacter sp. IMCC21906 TaxID=1620392 RepID=UPI00062DEAA4|nr:AraC family transcriptional regulator [Spongiibacter sp. IMCC21906]AKH70377.1 DNA-binding domain-containing protein, AraC-type [Spongiibacter sp. IMCC21906]